MLIRLGGGVSRGDEMDAKTEIMSGSNVHEKFRQRETVQIKLHLNF